MSKPKAGPPAFVVAAVMQLQQTINNFARRLAPPHVYIMETATGNWRGQLVFAAAKLGLADLLKDGPKSVRDMAKMTGTDPDALYRVLRALAMLGIFKETENRIFVTTSYGKTLERDHPDSVLPLAQLVGEDFWAKPWAQILYSLKTGTDSFSHAIGSNIFDYLKSHPEQWSIFNAWMTRVSNMNCPVIASSFPFSNYKTIVDVGGGEGSLISHILERHPGVSGILYDLPEVVREPRGIKDSVSSRCKIEAGSFFESVPKGADIYIMQQIIHDWNDELCIKILRNCLNAMNRDGRVLIVDAVIKPGNAMDINKFLDIQMMLLTNGRERTADEFRQLLESAGLSLSAIHRTATMFSLIEAKPL